MNRTEAIMKVLESGGWIAGRDLRERANKHLAWWRRLRRGTCYIVFSRMQDNGLIESRDNEYYSHGHTLNRRLYRCKHKTANSNGVNRIS